MPLIGASYHPDAATLGSIETYTTAMAQAEADQFEDLEAIAAVYDYRPADSAALNAIAGMRLGDKALQVDTAVVYRYNGSAWKAWESDWTAYTPTLTGFTVGTGGSAANVAAYRYVAGRILIRGYAKLGSSGASVSGTISVSIPVNRTALNHAYQAYKGIATMFDDSATTNYLAFPAANNASVSAVSLFNSGTNGLRVGSTNIVPFTWAAADAISYDFEYDPA